MSIGITYYKLYLYNVCLNIVPVNIKMSCKESRNQLHVSGVIVFKSISCYFYWFLCKYISHIKKCVVCLEFDFYSLLLDDLLKSNYWYLDVQEAAVGKHVERFYPLMG